MDDQELTQRLRRYHWYHFIRLNDHIETPGVPDHVPSHGKTLRAMDRVDFPGKRVLDIGCRDGLFSLEAERRGAAEVIGIDNDLSRGAVELVIPYLGSQVRMHQMNLLDLKRETFGAFDVVIFSGLLYHMRYPFWSLKLIRNAMVDGGAMVLETAIFVDANRFPLLYCPTGADGACGETVPTLFNLKGLTETLGDLGFEVQHQELQQGLSPGATPTGMEIDRVALVCRAIPDARKAKLVGYFEGTHDLHSGWATSYE
jgi:SAM-dependent methyltransferase